MGRKRDRKNAHLPKGVDSVGFMKTAFCPKAESALISIDSGAGF